MSHLDKKDVDVATVACNKEGRFKEWDQAYVWNSGEETDPHKEH